MEFQREAEAGAAGEDGGQVAWDTVPAFWKDEDGINFGREKLAEVFPATREEAKERKVRDDT
jgi:hypothetical protein